MVEESINLQVLHWPTPQGKVPQGDDNSWGKLLWTRASRIFLLCRKETMSKGVIGEYERCFRVTFEDVKILPNDITDFEIERMKS